MSRFAFELCSGRPKSLSTIFDIMLITSCTCYYLCARIIVISPISQQFRQKQELED